MITGRVYTNCLNKSPLQPHTHPENFYRHKSANSMDSNWTVKWECKQKRMRRINFTIGTLQYCAIDNKQVSLESCFVFSYKYKERYDWEMAKQVNWNRTTNKIINKGKQLNELDFKCGKWTWRRYHCRVLKPPSNNKLQSLSLNRLSIK